MLHSSYLVHAYSRPSFQPVTPLFALKPRSIYDFLVDFECVMHILHLFPAFSLHKTPRNRTATPILPGFLRDHIHPMSASPFHPHYTRMCQICLCSAVSRAILPRIYTEIPVFSVKCKPRIFARVLYRKKN